CTAGATWDSASSLASPAWPIACMLRPAVRTTRTTGIAAQQTIFEARRIASASNRRSDARKAGKWRLGGRSAGNARGRPSAILQRTLRPAASVQDQDLGPGRNQPREVLDVVVRDRDAAVGPVDV